MNLWYDPAIPLLGTYPDKAIILKDTHTPVFIAELFIIIRTWKQCRCPSTDEWIKRWHTHTHTHTHTQTHTHIYVYIHIMEYYIAIKRTDLSQF